MTDDANPPLSATDVRARYWPERPNPGQTHWDGCWRFRRHHNCAILRIEELEAALAQGGAPPEDAR